MAHTCEEWQEEISAYIDDELAEPDKEALEQHVSSCPDCQSCLTAYRTVSGVLTGWQVQPPEVLRKGIVYKAQKNQKASAVLWRRWISLGSVAAALLLVTWLVNGHSFQLTNESEPVTFGAGTEMGGEVPGQARTFNAVPAAEDATDQGSDAMGKAADSGDEPLLSATRIEGTQSDVTIYYVYLLVDLPQAELATLPNAESQTDGSVLIPVEEMESLLQKWEKESVSNSGKTQVHNAASDKVCLISSRDG